MKPKALPLSLAAVLASSARIQINIVADFRAHVREQYLTERRRLEKWAIRVADTDEEMAVSDQAWVLDEILSLANEMAIVALYRVVELDTQTILRWCYGEKAKALYRFDRMSARLLLDFGCDVRTLPNCASANELRILNNAIKHTKRVSAELAEYPGWQAGDALSGLDKAFERLAKRDRLPSYLQHLGDAVLRGTRAR